MIKIDADWIIFYLFLVITIINCGFMVLVNGDNSIYNTSLTIIMINSDWFLLTIIIKVINL